MKAMYNTMIVNDMEESVAFYKDICGFEIDSTYDLPNGAQITLLKSGEHTYVELIKDNVHEVGYYSIGMDVEDIEKEIEDLRSKGVEILLEPTKTSVGSMARIKDVNGVNIVLIQHNPEFFK